MRSLAGSRVAAIAGRRGWPRFRRGATEVSACGGGYGRKGASRRLAAICGRSDHQIDGDLVIPPFQRCPRSRLDRGSSRHGGLPLGTVAKVGIKTIASRQQLRGSRPTSTTDDPRAIVMMHSVYEIRVTLSTKKSMHSGREGWQLRQRYAVRPGSRALRTDVSCHLPFHFPDMAGSAELKLMECWRSPAFDDRSPLLDLGFVMRARHRRLLVACGIF